MNRAGDQLFAGAALALDQYVGRQVADLGDDLEDTLHRLALSDDVLKAIARLDFSAQPLHFLSKRLLLQRALDLDENLIVVERFGDVMKSAGAHGFHRALDGSERGNQEH